MPVHAQTCRCREALTVALLLLVFTASSVSTVNARLPRGNMQQHASTDGSPLPVCTGIDISSPIVTEGSWIEMRAYAYVPTCQNLSYGWTATGGNIVRGLEFEPVAVFDSAGVEPGDYEISLWAADLLGHVSVACTRSIRVLEWPGDSQPVALRASRSYVRAGDSIAFVVDPVKSVAGLQLNNLVWTSSAGELRQDGSSVSLDTSGLDGKVTISATAPDTSPKVSGSIEITVVQSSTCGMPINMDVPFERNKATVTTPVQRATLDGIARMLDAYPQEVLIVGGCVEAGERPGLARERAECVVKYLVTSHRRFSNRIVTRVFDPYPSVDWLTNPRVSIAFRPGPVGANDCGTSR